MDLITALKKENARILKELRKLEDTSAHQPEERNRLLHELQALVNSRQRVEEDNLYPLLDYLPGTKDLIGRVRRENGEIQAVLLELDQAAPADRHFELLVENLASLLRAHLQWEEHELYPAAREVISEEQLEMIGDRAQEEFDYWRRQPAET